MLFYHSCNDFLHLVIKSRMHDIWTKMPIASGRASVFLKLALWCCRGGWLQASSISSLDGLHLQRSVFPILGHCTKAQIQRQRVLEGHRLQYTSDLTSWPVCILLQKLRRSGEAQGWRPWQEELAPSFNTFVPLWGKRDDSGLVVVGNSYGGQAGSHSSVLHKYREKWSSYQGLLNLARAQVLGVGSSESLCCQMVLVPSQPGLTGRMVNT